MSGIVLQTTMLNIVNKGGGIRTKRTGEVKRDAAGRLWETIKRSEAKGSDYVVFKCPNPRCGKRNKKGMREAKYVKASEGRVAFVCYACLNTIEVSKPAPSVSLAI